MAIFDDGNNGIKRQIGLKIIMEDKEKTYVFDNTEVRKTGRVAKRTLKSNNVDIQIEVTPVHMTSGAWKKWTRENELFEIVGE